MPTSLSRPQRQGHDPDQGLSGARMGRHDLGLYGPGRRACRNCPRWRWRWCRPRTATSPRNGRTATGCRRWKAASTPRISPSRISPSKRKRTKSSTSRSTSSIRCRASATDHMRWIAEDPRPVIKILPHEAGLTVAGGRLTDGDDIYWRIAQFLMPVHAYAPTFDAGREHLRPELRPGDRHQLLDLHLCLESGAPADATPSARAIDRRQRRDVGGRRELHPAAQQGTTTT